MIRFSKKFTSIAFVLMLLCASAFTVFAAESDMLVDDNGLFDSNEAAKIEEALDSASLETGWDVRIYVADYSVSADNMEEYYNNFYDSSDYKEDGVLLVIDNDSDRRIIITKGDAMQYFSDERMNDIKSDMKVYLDDNDYYNAALTYARDVESFYTDGEDTDGSYENVELNKNDVPIIQRTFDNFGVFIIVIPIVAGIVFFVMILFRYSFHGADNTYDLQGNSKLELTGREDRFVTSHVTSRRLSNDNDNNSSSGSSSKSSSHGSSGVF